MTCPRDTRTTRKVRSIHNLPMPVRGWHVDSGKLGDSFLRRPAFTLPGGRAGPRIKGRPDAWFSSRKCVGGMFFDNRTCLLRNVCFEKGKTIFFQDPRTAQPIAHDSPYDLVWLDSYPIPEPVTRESVFNLWGPHAVSSLYPRPMREEELSAVLHVLWKPFNDDNMAHILWDNIYALYVSMTVLEVLHHDVQVWTTAADYRVLLPVGYYGVLPVQAVGKYGYHRALWCRVLLWARCLGATSLVACRVLRWVPMRAPSGIVCALRRMRHAAGISAKSSVRRP
jgi:hypothetical protein